MENETVGQSQLLRLKHHSERVLDVRIESDAPAFMADDTLAVFTGGLGVVPVCVIPRCGIGEHGETSEIVFVKSPVAYRESSQEIHLYRAYFTAEKVSYRGCHATM